jgi:hypothetical protein
MNAEWGNFEVTLDIVLSERAAIEFGIYSKR